MTVFKSVKVLPYVYMLEHINTGEFYFGYRCANKVPSSEDLGKVYFTSGKYTKQNFNSFEFTIIAEFFKPDDAYLFEQSLILTHWDNPLILNRWYRKTSGEKFMRFGPHSEESKTKMSETKKKNFQNRTEEQIRNDKARYEQRSTNPENGKRISESKKGKTNGQLGYKRSKASLLRMSQSQLGHNRGKGYVHTPEAKEKYKNAQQTRIYTIQSPSGEIYDVIDFRDFCFRNNICPQRLKNPKFIGKAMKFNKNIKNLNTVGWKTMSIKNMKLE